MRIPINQPGNLMKIGRWTEENLWTARENTISSGQSISLQLNEQSIKELILKGHYPTRPYTNLTSSCIGKYALYKRCFFLQ